MWPLQRIARSWFKVNSAGTTIYFPFGVLGSGYEVRDAKLVRRVNWAFHVEAIAFAIVLALEPVFGPLPAILGMPGLGAAAAIYNVCLVRGLAKSSERLTARDVWSVQSPWFMAVFVLLFLFATLAILGCGFLVASGPLNVVLLGAVGIVVSAVSAFWALTRLRLLYELWRERARDGA